MIREVIVTIIISFSGTAPSYFQIQSVTLACDESNKQAIIRQISNDLNNNGMEDFKISYKCREKTA